MHGLLSPAHDWTVSYDGVPKLWSAALRWSAGMFEVVPRDNAMSTLIVNKKSFNTLDPANWIKRVMLFPGQLRHILKIIYLDLIKMHIFNCINNFFVVQWASVTLAAPWMGLKENSLETPDLRHKRVSRLLSRALQNVEHPLCTSEHSVAKMTELVYINAKFNVVCCKVGIYGIYCWLFIYGKNITFLLARLHPGS